MNLQFWFGISLLSCFISFALIGPLFSPHSYDSLDLAQQNTAPSAAHWLGTDELGRDLFARASQGARISLFVGVSAAFIDMVVGVLFGAIAAFSPPRLGHAMMMIADLLYALPQLLVVILVVMVAGSGMGSLILALSILGWITMARVVRGQILYIRELEYVKAAQLLGAGFWRILLRHLIPNVFGAIMVTLTLTIPTAIFSEAFLSFLGLGIQAPVASWGTMASEGLPAMLYYPWRLFVPAIMISGSMFSFHLVGEALRTRYQEEELCAPS